MIRRSILAVLLALVLVPTAGPAAAQYRVPVLRRGPPPPLPPVPLTIEAVRAQFVAMSGSDTIYFAGSTYGLDAAAIATLNAQAAWLRMNPMIVARIEGHSDGRSTRDHALALGERRADAVRDYLVLQGVPSNQVSVISWGKERPPSDGALALNSRAVTVLMPR